jgi:hypothetical protein
MAAAVAAAPRVSVGSSAALFDLRAPTTGFPYDVARDGRFLVNRLDTPSGDAT